MTKFRQNHSKQGNRGSSGFMTRIVSFTIMLFAMAIGVFYFLSTGIGDTGMGNHNNNRNHSSNHNYEPSAVDASERNYIPSNSSGEVVHHKYYSLSYIEKYEQAEWVAYHLTAESLRAKNVPRAKNFKPDYSVNTGSAFHKDYSHSGYTRGHLAPAGDMAFSTDAMQECFYMSNMSPQPRTFNNGIWKELEEQVRDWAYDHKALYIVTGPILKNIDDRIGKNKVGVPKQFYKIIMDLEKPDQKAISFIIPNVVSDRKLQDYAVSIDDVEKETGIDFFADLLDDDIESDMESTYDVRDWEFDKKRYRNRVEKWNHQ